MLNPRAATGLGSGEPSDLAGDPVEQRAHISAIDAERMLSIVGNDDLASVAHEVRAKLAAVVERAGKPS